jgi:tryptophanyl-tRNA synthetase
MKPTDKPIDAGKTLAVSGIRPTQPALHLGNYFGALRQFLDLQEAYSGQCYFFVADLHSFADVTDRETLALNSLGVATEFLAAGLDPDRATLFIQSDVPELMAITWLLTGVALDTQLLNLPHYRLKRDQFAMGQEVTGAPALYLTYPILQAADILAPAAHNDRILVPVGEDQKPHIEFARELVRRFNQRYGAILGLPDAYTRDDIHVRVKGLDGQEKMGKSQRNAVYLGDTPEEIRRLVRRGVTDPKRQRQGDAGEPDECVGIYPLHQLTSTPAQLSHTIRPGCRSGALRCVECKAILSDNLVSQFSEFRERKEDFSAHPEVVREIVAEGGKRARALAQAKLKEMSDAMGLSLSAEPRHLRSG